MPIDITSKTVAHKKLVIYEICVPVDITSKTVAYKLVIT